MFSRKTRGIISVVLCLCLILCGAATISANTDEGYLYYDQLSTTAKNIYNVLKNITPTTTQVKANVEPITVSINNTAGREQAQNEIAKEMQAAIDAVFRDHPEIYWVKLGANGTSYAVYYFADHKKQEITYDEVEINIVIQDQYADDITEINDSLWELIRNFEITGNTRYDKVKSIHDYLCRNISYKITDYCYEAVGALNYNEAVCEGISEAFKMICDYNDIPCVSVSGTGVTTGGAGGSGPHMWNYVKMEDGRWYAVDATWDLGRNHTALYDYFLVGSDTLSKYYDDTFSQSHIANGDFSGTGSKVFEYPELSEYKYIKGLHPIEPTTTTQKPTTTAPDPTTASDKTTTTDAVYNPSGATENTMQSTLYPITDEPNDIVPTQSIQQKITLSKVRNLSVKGGKRKATITFKKVKGAKRYVIKYSYKKNMKGAKTKTVKKAKVTLKKLKSRKRIYVKVRAKSGSVLGKYSIIKNAKIK